MPHHYLTVGRIKIEVEIHLIFCPAAARMTNGQSDVPIPPDAMVVSLEMWPTVRRSAALSSRRRLRLHSDDADATLLPGAAATVTR